MDVLLINPWICDFKAFDFWMKPLGLLLLGKYLKDVGLNVSIVDCMDRFECPPPLKNTRFGCGKFPFHELSKPQPYSDIPRKWKIHGISNERLCQKLDEIEKPKVILVTSSITYWFYGVFETIKILKIKFPQTPIILGGIYATLCHKHALDHSGADFVINGCGFSDEARNLISNITGKNLPISSPMEIENPLCFYEKLTYGMLLTSLGCPFNCSYCASKILQKGFSRKNIKPILNELEILDSKYKVKDCVFYDDALLYKKNEHFIPLARKIINLKEKFRFHTPNAIHARWIDEETANLLYEMGFETIRIGLESISEDFLKKSGEKINLNDLENAIRALKKAGFTSSKIGVYYMLNVPGQTSQEIFSAIKYIMDLKVKMKFADFSPIPGTKLGDELLLPYTGDINWPLCQNNTYYAHNYSVLNKTEYEKIKEMLYFYHKALNEN